MDGERYASDILHPQSDAENVNHDLAFEVYLLLPLHLGREWRGLQNGG